MRYSPDEFFSLIDEVERQGGEHLDKTHENVMHDRYTGPKVLPVRDRVTDYCNESALFLVPYNGGDGFVEACAVDDMMGRWPRFAGIDAKGIV